MLGVILSEGISQKMAEVRKEAEINAGKLAATLQAGLLGTGEGDGSGSEKEQERIQRRLDRLNESFFTEFEMLKQKFDNEQTLLEEALKRN